MKLNDFEIQSSTWLKLSTYYKDKLSLYRARIENPNLDEKARIALCWQIKVIKELLNHAEKEDLSSADESHPSN